MPVTSTILGITTPSAADAPNGPANTLEMVNDMESVAKLRPNVFDTHANRPAAGTQGRRFYSTDRKQEWFDTGSVWMLMGGTLPAVKVHNAAGGNTATGATVKIPMDTSEFDIGHLGTTHFDNANDRVVSRIQGIYQVGGRLSYSAHAVGNRKLYLRKNGETLTDHGFDVAWADPGGGQGTINIDLKASAVVDLAAGDYFELWAFQSSGTTLSYDSGASGELTQLWMHWVGNNV